MVKSSQSHKDSLTQKKKFKPNRLNRLINFLNITATSLLLVWVIVGNLIASQVEKPLLQAKAEMISRFPKIETNISAIKTEELSAKLGLSRVVPRKEKRNSYSVAKVDSEEFEKIRSELVNYLDSYSIKSGDLINPPSKLIQSYLSRKSSQIASIRSHLINSIFPRWETISLSEIFNSTFFQSYPSTESSMIQSLSTILLVEALNNVRLGKNQLAIDTIEAQDKLNQFLILYTPDYLPLIISTISFRQQIKILRAIDRVTTELQQRKIPDYRQYFFANNQIRNLVIAEIFRSLPLTKGGIYKNAESLPWLNRILLPFQRPYWVFAAIDTWERRTKELTELFNHDICQPHPHIPANYSLSWWNLSGNIELQKPIGPGRAYRVLLDWDLTQKIMNLREIAYQTGGFPKSLPTKGFSPICKNFRYVYQASPQGDKMTISLENIPAWLNEDKNGLPLTYTDHFKKT
jgi:hypothetical protein